MDNYDTDNNIQCTSVITEGQRQNKTNNREHQQLGSKVSGHSKLTLMTCRQNKSQAIQGHIVISHVESQETCIWKQSLFTAIDLLNAKIYQNYAHLP